MREDTRDHVGLDELTVSDIMMRDVVTVTPELSVADLIRLFEFEQISGAPVVEEGRVIGVVSVTDVMRLAAHEAEIASGDTMLERDWVEEDVDDDDPIRTRKRLAYFLDPAEYPALFAATEGKAAFSQSTVREIMTPATFSVHPATSIIELARFLARGRIHRSLVIDGDRLDGIVTTFDVVRAVAGEATVAGMT
jgi:CBS domain-containing protein